MATRGPYLPNLEPLIQAGVDPRTGLPRKATTGDKAFLKENIKRTLRIQDTQDALNRYSWFNLPSGLDGNFIERLLYFKGQGAFFYLKNIETFFFLPYALSGDIDVYGRYKAITPLPFGVGSTEEEKKKYSKPWITGLNFNVKHDILLPEDRTEDDIVNSAVLLWDYSKSISENILPRNMIQDTIIDVMSECIPLMRTSLINNCGVKGMRVNSEDEASGVKSANDSIVRASLTGNRFVPMIGVQDFQDLSSTSGVANAQEFLMTYQSLNNLRLSAYGMSSGSVFQKLGTTLQSEQDMNLGNQQHIMDDGLYQRQKFCNIVNSIWNLGIWCEVAQQAGLDGTNENVANAFNDLENNENEGDDTDEWFL